MGSDLKDPNSTNGIDKENTESSSGFISVEKRIWNARDDKYSGKNALGTNWIFLQMQ